MTVCASPSQIMFFFFPWIAMVIQIFWMYIQHSHTQGPQFFQVYDLVFPHLGQHKVVSLSNFWFIFWQDLKKPTLSGPTIIQLCLSSKYGMLFITTVGREEIKKSSERRDRGDKKTSEEFLNSSGKIAQRPEAKISENEACCRPRTEPDRSVCTTCTGIARSTARSTVAKELLRCIISIGNSSLVVVSRVTSGTRASQVYRGIVCWFQRHQWLFGRDHVSISKYRLDCSRNQIWSKSLQKLFEGFALR